MAKIVNWSDSARSTNHGRHDGQAPAGTRLFNPGINTLTQFLLNLRNFAANIALSRLRAFWGALLAKIWWMGAQKHFSGQRDSGLIKNHSKDLYIFIYLNSEDQWKIATIIFFYNTTSWYRFNLKLIYVWKSRIPNMPKKHVGRISHQLLTVSLKVKFLQFYDIISMK